MTLAVPRSPAIDILLPDDLEGLREGCDSECRGRTARRTEAEAQCAASWQFTQHRNIARPRPLVRPGHCPVTIEILPTVTEPDITDAHPTERITLRHIHRGKCETERALLGPQDLPVVMPACRCNIVEPRTTKMWRQQDIGLQRRIAFQYKIDKQYIATGIRYDPYRQGEAFVTVNDAWRRDTWLRQLQRVVFESFRFTPETRIVCNDESQVTNLRQVDAREIDLVDDTVANSKPEATGAERRTDYVFGARRPRGADSRRAGRIVSRPL